MDMFLRAAALGTVLVMAVGCSGEPSHEATSFSEMPIVKIAVATDGRITLDGKAASLSEVGTALEKLVQDKGRVWYYRAEPAGEPHENAMLVIQAIVDAKLPISMSTKPDFSDVVLQDGTTKPR